MQKSNLVIGVAALAATLLAGASALAGGQQPTPSSGPVGQLAHADSLLKQGEPNQALALLKQLEAQYPGMTGLDARIGNIYYQKRDYINAVAYLKKATQENPNDGESVQLLGLSYYLMGHLPQAIPLLEKVQSWMPRPNVTGSYILGISYMQTRQFDKARAAFAKMFSVPADSAGAYEALAKMMLGQDFEAEAVGQLQKALQLNPRLPMAHFMLGEIYLYKSNVPGALAEFQKELAINPIAWYVYWRMGDAYTRIENWNEAERALKQAAWLNPDFSGPYILLGKVELKKGLPHLAAGFLERALKIDPNNYSAHYMLGTAYKQLGRTADADREFRLSEKLHSGRLQ